MATKKLIVNGKASVNDGSESIRSESMYLSPTEILKKKTEIEYIKLGIVQLRKVQEMFIGSNMDIYHIEKQIELAEKYVVNREVKSSPWTEEITRELYYVNNLVWYIKACLTLDKQFMSIYLDQKIPARYIMTDIDRHQIYSSIIYEARKTYNEMFRVNSDRVVISNGKDIGRMGYIFCYDDKKKMFQVHLDREDDDKTNAKNIIKYFHPNQLTTLELDTLNTLQKKHKKDYRHFFLKDPPSPLYIKLNKYEMTIDKKIFNCLPKSNCDNHIIDNDATYYIFTRLVKEG